MPSHPSSNVTRCSACHAVISAGARRCWLCGASLASDISPAGAQAIVSTPRRPTSATPAHGFSLASLMMFVTLASVVLGVSTIAPGIGIPLGIIALLAWGRTATVIRLRKRRHQETTIGEKAGLFAASLGVVVTAGVATAIAFFATCFAGFWAGAAAGGALGAQGYDPLGWGFVTGGLIGGVVGLWVFYRLMKRMTPSNCNGERS